MRHGWRLLLAASILVNLVVLYAPSSPGGGGVPHVDKAVHLAVFGAVAFCAARSGFAVRPVLGLLVLHAVVSEVVQHTMLADRSGDPWDVLADVLGAVLGWVLGRAGLGSGLGSGDQGGGSPARAPGTSR